MQTGRATRRQAPGAAWFPSRWGPIAWWLALLALAGLTALVVSGTSQSADVEVSQWTYPRRTDALTRLAEAVTWAGTFPWVVAITGGAAAAIDRRLRTPWRTVIRIALVLTADVVVVWAIKEAVDRARPDVDMRLATVQTASFPSGHATATSAAASVLVLTVLASTMSRRARSTAVLIGMLAVVAMCWSRVYLGVHYLSDVAAGAVLGLWLALSIAWLSDALRAGSGSRRAAEEEVTEPDPPAAASPDP